MLQAPSDSCFCNRFLGLSYELYEDVQRELSGRILRDIAPYTILLSHSVNEYYTTGDFNSRVSARPYRLVLELNASSIQVPSNVRYDPLFAPLFTPSQDVRAVHRSTEIADDLR